MLAVASSRSFRAPRFLTDREKVKVLEQWERTKRSNATGVGIPDPEIVPWCDQINALEGICTLQSCAGHVRNGVIKTAHFWIWMTEEVTKSFEKNVYELVGNPLIDRVIKIYLDGGEEVACIYFYGSERDSLTPSVEAIYGFLCRLSASCSRHKNCSALY